MTIKYDWTDGNDVRVYLDGEELTDEPIPNNGSSRMYDGDGLPLGLAEYINEYLAEVDIPSDLGYSDAIMMLASIQAGDVKRR